MTEGDQLNIEKLKVMEIEDFFRTHQLWQEAIKEINKTNTPEHARSQSENKR